MHYFFHAIETIEPISMTMINNYICGCKPARQLVLPSSTMKCLISSNFNMSTTTWFSQNELVARFEWFITQEMTRNRIEYQIMTTSCNQICTMYNFWQPQMLHVQILIFSFIRHN